MNVWKMLSSWFRSTEPRTSDFDETYEVETTSSSGGDSSGSTAIGLVQLKRILELREVSRTNWNVLPKELREECLAHLQGWIPDEQVLEWKVFGFPRGFHLLGGGMQIRNRLRDVLRDEQLPPVEYPEGPMRNWDDYYMGALDELMERYGHDG